MSLLARCASLGCSLLIRSRGRVAIRPFVDDLTTKSIQVRSVFTDSYLGISGFLASKKRSEAHQTPKERFFDRLNEYLDNSDPSQISVFSDDLTNCIYLAEDDPYHLDTLERLIIQYTRQNQVVKLKNSFLHGPLVARLMHHLKKPELAFKLIRNKDLKDFFHQMISYTTVMDLLYETQHYNEVLELYEIICERFEDRLGHLSKDALTIAIMACYRLDTQESLERATKILTGDPEASRMRRAISIVSYMSIKKSDPSRALQLLSMSPQHRYITLRNVKLMALADLGRIEDTFAILRDILDAPRREDDRRGLVLQETIDRLVSARATITDTEICQMFDDLVETLKREGHVNESTMDSYLMAPIAKETSIPQNNRQGGDGRQGFRNFRTTDDADEDYAGDRYSSTRDLTHRGAKNRDYRSGGQRMDKNYSPRQDRGRNFGDSKDNKQFSRLV